MRYALILVYCCGTCWVIGQPPNCDLKRNADGIKVFTCKTENEKFKSLRAEFILENTTLQELKDFLWDVTNYQTWQYNVIESEMVSSSSQDEMVYRALIHAPWPVENRELAVQMILTNDVSGLHISIHSIPYNKPTPEGVIRIPLFDASWSVVITGTTLQVTYSLRIDPGGSVPAWLANIAMADGPLISFRNLKKQLVK
jgi:hypothetical protein